MLRLVTEEQVSLVDLDGDDTEFLTDVSAIAKGSPSLLGFRTTSYLWNSNLALLLCAVASLSDWQRCASCKIFPAFLTCRIWTWMASQSLASCPRQRQEQHGRNGAGWPALAQPLLGKRKRQQHR